MKLGFPLVCFVLAVLLSLGILSNRWSSHLGVPALEGSAILSDSGAQLGGALACAHGVGTWYGRVCFYPDIDTTPRMQAYGLWIVFQRWGLQTQLQADVLGYAAIVSFMLAASLILYPQSMTATLVCVALLHTAGIHLAVERANYDLYMAALLTVAGAFLAKAGRLRGMLGLAALGLATALKLYCGLACLAAFWVAERLRPVWFGLGLLFCLLAVASVGFNEFILLGRGAPEGYTRFSTGAWWLWRNDYPVAAIIAPLTAVLLAGGLFWMLRRVQAPDWQDAPVRRTVFELSVLTWGPLFLMKDSFDYRFVLLFPALGLLLWLWTQRGVHMVWRATSLALIVCFASAAGLELPLHWNDRFSTPVPPDALVVAKQFCAWLLAAGLAVMLAYLWLERLTNVISKGRERLRS